MEDYASPFILSPVTSLSVPLRRNIFFKASNSKSNMERKSLLLLLIPLYMVYFGISLLTDIVPRILDALERDSFLEIVVIFGGMGATIIAAVFSVLFGILWARKIILGEDTGVI